MPLIPGADAIVGDVIANVIVNAGTWALKSSYDLAQMSLDDLQEPSDALQRAVAQSLDPLLNVGQLSPEIGGERFRSFLDSPDVFNFVQRLFLAEITGHNDAVAAMQEEFLQLWTFWVGIPTSKLRPHCKRIFPVICRAVSSAASEATRCGLEPPTTPGTHLVLLTRQLAAIERRLTFLQGEHSVESFHEFERQLRKQIQEKFARLTPPHIDDARRVPLDDIYVEPTFSARTGKTWSHERLSLADVRRQLLRSVLVGQPGGGKSTLTSKLCLDLTRQYDERLVGGVALCPVPVTLREYGSAREERQLSIVDFIEEACNTDFQLQPPKAPSNI